MTTPLEGKSAASAHRRNDSMIQTALNLRNRDALDPIERYIDALSITSEQFDGLLAFRGGNEKAVLHGLKYLIHAAVDAEAGGEFDGQTMDISKYVNILANTGRLVKSIPRRDTKPLGIDFTEEVAFTNEGLFNLDVKWNGVRLLQVGFFVDENNSLVIENSQRHKLDQVYRSDKMLTGNIPEEKRQGDIIMKEIKSETGLEPEAFGAIFASMFLSQYLPGDKILFLNFEEREKIKGLRRRSWNKHRINHEVEEWRKFMDFKLMLTQIGVGPNDGDEGKFFSLSAANIKAGFQTRFTDDKEYPNRFKYRQAIYSLVTP